MCVTARLCLYVAAYLCEQLFEEGADERSYLVSVQQVKLPFGVGVVVNDAVGVAVIRAAALPRGDLQTFTVSQRCQMRVENYKRQPSSKLCTSSYNAAH